MCSHCGRAGPTYDTQPERRFMMISIWIIAVFFTYRPRRISCRHCRKVSVESIPWAVSQKSPLTTAMAHHLAGWARFLPWKQVAARCQTSWKMVAKSVSWLVSWGLDHRSLDCISAIGVDEIQHAKGHRYSTLVYQIDAGRRRLLWIGKDRTKQAFRAFFDTLGTQRCKSIKHVCSDMWRPYLDVIKEKLPQAVNILDRFHIALKLNKAVDDTRRSEVRNLRKKGKAAHLKKSRWVWLKRPCNLKRKQRSHLRNLLSMNLTTVKAYLFKESFDHLWSYKSPAWAAKFIKRWCRDVMRHRSLPELKKFVKTIRSHESLILNYFRAKSETGTTFSSGVVEGLNNKVKVCLRKSYGFRSEKYREVALYHALGDLPEPSATHRFG